MYFRKLKGKSLNIIKNKKKLNNLKVRKYCFNVKRTYSVVPQILVFHFPQPWEFIFFKVNNNSNIYLYTSTFFFRFSIPKTVGKLSYSQNTSSIIITTLYGNNFYRMYWDSLRNLFSTLNKPLFLKLKFKGKGYYIYKNRRNTITPQFGYAHRTYIYAYFVTVKFLSKTSIFLFGFSKKDLFDIAYKIKAMRPINIFTGRGVRFSREIVYRKQGKVSSYR